MERETEILSVYLAMREAIDQRISELKALRALCSPAKAGQGNNRGNADADGAWANWSPEQREKSNASGAWTVAKRKLAAAQQAGDAAGISAAFDAVERALVRLNAAKLARDAAKRNGSAVTPVPAVPPVPEAPQIAPPEPTAACGSATAPDALIPTETEAPILPVPAENLTPEQRFAAAFQDGASVPSKPAKSGKPKSASVSIPAAGKVSKSARKGQKASV